MFAGFGEFKQLGLAHRASLCSAKNIADAPCAGDLPSTKVFTDDVNPALVLFQSFDRDELRRSLSVPDGIQFPTNAAANRHATTKSSANRTGGFQPAKTKWSMNRIKAS